MREWSSQLGGEGTCQTEILADKSCFAGKEIDDLFVDTGFAVSLVSSQFYKTISNRGQLQPIKNRYMVANGSLLNINESVELTVASDKIEIKHRFLCVDTNVLLGYDFLRKNKVDILTSANCLLIQNVPIITQMHKSRKTVGVILTANGIIEPYSENILEEQPDQLKAHLMSEESCILEPEILTDDRL